MTGSLESRIVFQTISLLLLLLLLVVSDSQADDKCPKLKQPGYELFGTKTTYTDARKFLRDIDNDDLPKPFDDDSIEKEHKELLKYQCVPSVFYFIGRHSARFPDREDIEQYNSDLDRLLEKIRTESTVCPHVKERFLQWRSKMQPKHDNLITEYGAQEEREIARRFKRLYPEFFDASKAEIQIGVTKKIRTAQTGAQFLSEVKGLLLPHCEEGSLPTNDFDQPSYDLDKILSAACYRNLIDKYEKPFLDFHKQCQKISGDKKIKDPRIDRVKNPALKKRIADEVAEKLGLDNNDPTPAITPEVLQSIFDMCKFESAMRNSSSSPSIWCSLFEKRDVEAMEYIEDVNSYFKDAYGLWSNPRQSCPLVKDLVEAFREGTKLGPERKRSYFYFSHADPIKKLMAVFGLFKDDESFSEHRLDEFERNLKVPKKRHWRSSAISPFSANMVFVLYRCESRNKPTKYRVLAAVTEQPVELGGCIDTDCNAERFFAVYDNMRDCDLNKVCGRAADR